jgi:hypothetical protein
MQRRLAVLATAAAMAAGAGSLLGPAHAADPLPADYPAAGCFTYTDPADDAVLLAFADADRDITGFALETTDSSLKAYARVPQLTNDPMSLAPFDGHRFSLKFTFNKHVFSASGSDYASGSGDAGSGSLRDGLAQTGHAGHVTQLGVDTPPIDPTNPDPTLLTAPGYVDSGLKVTFDYKNGWIVFDLPIADIEKYGEAKFTGDITALSIAGQSDEYAVGSVWDTAPDNDANGDPQGKWTVGDNKCFGPPAAVLTNVGATKVQYGDSATVATKVTDASGAPVNGAAVTFALGRLLTTAHTNARGIATAKLTPKDVAGAYTLVETYDGSATVGKATLSTPFSVAAEKTALAMKEASNGAKRTVTATLRDDDRHVLAKQRIAWFINGKAAGKGVTSSAGTVSLPVRRGATVKAVFAGAAGKYAGSSASHKT